MSASTKQLLAKIEDDLERLSALKQQIYYNFPRSTEAERDAIGDIIAGVCDRTESFKTHLKQEILNEL